MTSFPMTIEDVLASTDVLVDVQNASDSMTPEQCVEYRIACEKVLAEAKKAISDLNTQIVKTMERDVIRDGRRFYVGHKKDRVRFHHQAIQAQVITTATQVVEEQMHEAASMADHDVGRFGETERILVRAGARTAADLMAKIYISDSTEAKVKQVNALGLNTDRHNLRSVRTWEQGEKIVVDIPAGGAIE